MTSNTPNAGHLAVAGRSEALKQSLSSLFRRGSGVSQQMSPLPEKPVKEAGVKTERNRLPASLKSCPDSVTSASALLIDPTSPHAAKKRIISKGGQGNLMLTRVSKKRFVQSRKGNTFSKF